MLVVDFICDNASSFCCFFRFGGLKYFCFFFIEGILCTCSSSPEDKITKSGISLPKSVSARFNVEFASIIAGVVVDDDDDDVDGCGPGMGDLQTSIFCFGRLAKEIKHRLLSHIYLYIYN